MRTWGLAIILAGAAVLANPAHGDCQAELDDAADSFRRLVDKTRSQHAEEIAGMIERATEALSPEDAAALRNVIDTLIARSSPDEAHRAYVDNVIAMMTNEAELARAGVACSNKSVIRQTYDANLETYRAVLGQIELDVEERLDIEELAPDEGLVILALNSDEFIHHARINRAGSITGSITFGPVRPGEYFRVIRARGGDYVWEEIMQRRMMQNPNTWKTYEGKRLYRLGKHNFRFTVEPGKLNYVGVFTLDTIQNSYYRANFNDRLAIVVTALEQRYPGLLEQHEFANGLYPDDRFADFYLAEKQLLVKEGDDAR